jgi:hypothetical protein
MMLLFVGALVVGCGDFATEPGTVPGSDNAIDVSGVWDFTEILVLSGEVTTCRDTGSVNLVQIGTTLSGTGALIGTCHGILETFRRTGSFTISDGTVTDSSMSFLGVNGCRYIGTVSAGPPKRITGKSGCSVIFEGSWEAVVGAPVVSMDMEPESTAVVIGETTHLTAALRVGTGRRVFERAVSWMSSDSAAVMVSDRGDVTGIAVGTAVLTASVEGLSASARVTAEFVRFASVEPGQFYTCGVSTDGLVYCWGADDLGQAGGSANLIRCGSTPCLVAPAVVDRTLTFRSVSAGLLNSCGVTTTGTAYCWGGNLNGQFGNGSTGPEISTTPVAVSGGLDFASLSVGSEHTCGVASSGAAYCWGANLFNQLGNGSSVESAIPVAVSGGLTFASVNSLVFHSCGVATDTATYCWGANFDGRLGVDSLGSVIAPVAVIGGLTFASVSAGGVHSCGVTADGTAYCWGDNFYGELGVDMLLRTATPVAVSTQLKFTSVTTGAFHSCGLATDGSVHCWGANFAGQLADGSTDNSATPIQVAPGMTFASVAAGAFHSCGLSTDGVAYCWGANDNGELGNGSALPSPTVVLVLGQPQ